MFDQYEPLTCSNCQQEFFGRPPVEDGQVLCSECLANEELVPVSDDTKLSKGDLEAVEDELDGGKGEEDDDEDEA